MRRLLPQKWSPTAVFFALAAVCMVAQFNTVDNFIGRNLNPHYYDTLSTATIVIHTLNHIADALILLLPLVLLPARWKWAQWIVLWLTTLWCVAQMMYHPTYRDLMPFSSFLLVENVGPMLWESVRAAFRWMQLKVLLPPVSLWIVYQWGLKREIAGETASRKRRLIGAAAMLLGFAAIRTGVDTYYYSGEDEDKSFTAYLHDNYGIVWTRMSLYYRVNGFIPYTTYCAVTSLADLRPLNQRKKEEIALFLASQDTYSDNPYSPQGERKNLILIVVESLNSWVIDLKIDGREVTPTLNRLAADSTAIVTTHMKAQVKNGRSSDGIFMYHTGLLPLTSSTVAMRYGNDRFPSLVEALGSAYRSLYLCCDEPGVWNVSNMARGYGYEEFKCRDQIIAKLDKNNYNHDKTLLEEAGDYATHTRRPFALMVATVGMHQPYEKAPTAPTWISQSSQYTLHVRNYLEKTAAFDTALNDFLNRLEQEHILEHSVVVIMSDHNELIDDDPGGREAIDPQGDDCVFIALGSGHGKHIAGPVGQIDIYPTLLDLMGLNAYRWKGMGYSLMRNDVTSVVTVPGEHYGASPLLKRQQEAWRVSELLITSHYFHKQIDK